MYASSNFRTKKAFKQAVADGEQVTLFSPGYGSPKTDGTESVEGPWAPAMHTWYASVAVRHGIVVSVK